MDQRQRNDLDRHITGDYGERQFPKTVPCKYCEEPTEMLGTKQCDNCWEVATRIGGLTTQTLLRILHTTRPHEQWKPR
jgi:hypothetical protein